jgi:putative phosphoribosyl transferase
MRFTDRREAGRRLAGLLIKFEDQKPVVLALPRGGVPVGLEVALALGAPLDLVLVRKLGAPMNEELAIGAIAEGAPDAIIEPLAKRLRVSSEYIETVTARALAEIERRRRAWFGERQLIDVADRVAIVVDDGIATGATMHAALRATRQRKPSRLVLAVPVAAASAIRKLRREADEVVCLETPENFWAVGQFYQEFTQLSDAEVTELLVEAHNMSRPA